MCEFVPGISFKFYALNTECPSNKATSQGITKLTIKYLMRRKDVSIQTSYMYIFSHNIVYNYMYMCCIMQFVFYHVRTLLCFNSKYDIWVIYNSWRWSQNVAETCRNYFHVWTSAIRCKQTYLYSVSYIRGRNSETHRQPLAAQPPTTTWLLVITYCRPSLLFPPNNVRRARTVASAATSTLSSLQVVNHQTARWVALSSQHCVFTPVKRLFAQHTQSLLQCPNSRTTLHLSLTNIKQFFFLPANYREGNRYGVDYSVNFEHGDRYSVSLQVFNVFIISVCALLITIQAMYV